MGNPARVARFQGPAGDAPSSPQPLGLLPFDLNGQSHMSKSTVDQEQPVRWEFQIFGFLSDVDDVEGSAVVGDSILAPDPKWNACLIEALVLVVAVFLRCKSPARMDDFERVLVDGMRVRLTLILRTSEDLIVLYRDQSRRRCVRI